MSDTLSDWIFGEGEVARASPSLLQGERLSDISPLFSGGVRLRE